MRATRWNPTLKLEYKGNEIYVRLTTANEIPGLFIGWEPSDEISTTRHVEPEEKEEDVESNKK